MYKPKQTTEINIAGYLPKIYKPKPNSKPNRNLVKHYKPKTTSITSTKDNEVINNNNNDQNIVFVEPKDANKLLNVAETSIMYRNVIIKITGTDVNIKDLKGKYFILLYGNSLLQTTDENVKSITKLILNLVKIYSKDKIIIINNGHAKGVVNIINNICKTSKVPFIVYEPEKKSTENYNVVIDLMLQQCNEAIEIIKDYQESVTSVIVKNYITCYNVKAYSININ